MPRPPDPALPSDARRRASCLRSLPGLDHGFTGRRGPRKGRSLHLAVRPGIGQASAENVAGNWGDAIAPHDVRRLAIVSQVHGDRVVVDPRPRGALRPVAEADALVTTGPGVVVAVRVADCVPVLLAAVADGSVLGVAAVHAGWRGAAAGVVPRAVAALCDAASIAPGSLVAAVGPSICGAHYEVGEEVVAGLEASGVPPSACVLGVSPRGRPLVDVASAVLHQLDAAGVATIERVPGCTYEDDDLWSHRRDGVRGGRQAAWIVRTA